MNEFKNVGFFPIKNKILPQFEEVTNTESNSQTKPQTKSQVDIQTNDTHKLPNSTKSVSTPSLGLKILSPVSGKEIPVGNLTIFGISTDNEKSNCSVSVDWNNQKPFQKATAAGPYGNDDYSSWTFTYSPSFHIIENGINDLTSKLECQENSKVITKWHSINVTGVITNDSLPISTTSIDYDPLRILPQLNTLSTKPSANISSIVKNETTILPSTPVQPLTKLATTLVLSKDQISPGDTQNITVKISDSKTLQYVGGANVDIKVMQGSAILNQYNGTADTSGAYSHSWNIGSDTPSGKYDVMVSASASGYEPASQTGSFEIQRQLLVEASFLKDLVVPGDNQTIDVKVMDANTKQVVSGANVLGKIGGNKFSSNTDDNGAISYSWDTSPTSGGNSYQITLDVSDKGYPKVMKTVSFKMDRPQNLLEPPISNEENNIVSVNSKDLNNNLQDQNKFEACSSMLSNFGCSNDVNDKPKLNLNSDDKPSINSDDKQNVTDNRIENIEHQNNENDNNAYDFLASITK